MIRNLGTTVPLSAALLLAGCGAAAAPAASSAVASATVASPSAAAATTTAKPSPASSLQTLTVAYSSPSITEIPIYIAQQKGFLREQGFDAQVPYIRGSAELAAAVISNNVQVAYTTSEAVLAGAMEGGIQPVLLTMTDSHYAYNVVASPDIKSFAELAGKTFSIGTGPGTNPDFALTAELEARGMKADAVKRVSGGDTATRAAALQSGKVDATLLDPPYDLPVIDKGFSLVASVTDDVKKPVAGAVLYTTRGYASAHRDQMVAVTKAIIKAVRFGKTNPDETKKLISSWTKIEDQRALDRAYDFYFTKLLSDQPYPTPEAVQTSIENSAKARKKDTTLKPEDVIDASYVKQALQQLGG